MKKYFISACLLLTGCGVLFDDPITRFWNGGYFLFPDKEYVSSDGKLKTYNKDEFNWYEKLSENQKNTIKYCQEVAVPQIKKLGYTPSFDPNYHDEEWNKTVYVTYKKCLSDNGIPVYERKR